VSIETEKHLRILRRAFEQMEGKDFEPKEPRHPTILWAIENGFMKRADGRCGFEKIKDAFVVWTPAGRMAMQVPA
jgi:hypothetical protein